MGIEIHEVLFIVTNKQYRVYLLSKIYVIRNLLEAQSSYLFGHTAVTLGSTVQWVEGQCTAHLLQSFFFL